MSGGKRKIINDPVYGFISIDHPLIFDIIQHPYYQRLRRISQMALADLVYPGATHSRLLHSLGAYHLMGLALEELRKKEVKITEEEATAARLAILLHDVGHGPYSHALENTIVEGVTHEEISQWIMERLNKFFGHGLDLAMAIFNDRHPKRFLHQLVSSQLDVDRMDYLNRDSFYTGVYEGVIGYDRIIKMLTVHGGELMVEEKGIHSIEKFIIARRLMYWQVYLHKTVLSAENMLVKILQRAKKLSLEGVKLPASPALAFFMQKSIDRLTFAHNPAYLDRFCQLDDYDLLSAIKVWADHSDKVLSTLCRWLIDRRLFKTEWSTRPFEADRVAAVREKVTARLGLSEEEAAYFVFTDVTTNRTYNVNDEQINILFKNGAVTDIASVENALISSAVTVPIKKFYICYPRG